MGSGKSTLGKQLANKIGYRFMDMDSMIEKTSGLTIPEIFSEYGEEIFRKWEHDILNELLVEDNIVVATGGGAPCHHNHMQMMNQNGITIYIHLLPGSIKERLSSSSTKRPLIEGKSGDELLEYITAKLEERESWYNMAQIIVEGLDLKVDELLTRIKDSNQ